MQLAARMFEIRTVTMFWIVLGLIKLGKSCQDLCTYARKNLPEDAV